MVEIHIAAMISECSTVRIALREIQGILNQNTNILVQKVTEPEISVVEYVQTDFRGILGTCLFVFSLLNERLERLNVQSLNKWNKATAMSKVRGVWSDDSMRELREHSWPSRCS
jgi:hypothetical protein